MWSLTLSLSASTLWQISLQQYRVRFRHALVDVCAKRAWGTHPLTGSHAILEERTPKPPPVPNLGVSVDHFGDICWKFIGFLPLNLLPVAYWAPLGRVSGRYGADYCAPRWCQVRTQEAFKTQPKTDAEDILGRCFWILRPFWARFRRSNGDMLHTKMDHGLMLKQPLPSKILAFLQSKPDFQSWGRPSMQSTFKNKFQLQVIFLASGAMLKFKMGPKGVQMGNCDWQSVGHKQKHPHAYPYLRVKAAKSQSQPAIRDAFWQCIGCKE